jgi:hypothetical protein
MYWRQAQLFCAACFAGQMRGCLPRLPYCQLCAAVMSDSVEESETDAEGMKNGRGVMRVVCREV